MAEAGAGSLHGGDAAAAPGPAEEQELSRRLRRLYPAVNQEETPLPRSWSPKDKYNYIGLSQGNLRVHYKGAGAGAEAPGWARREPPGRAGLGWAGPPRVRQPPGKGLSGRGTRRWGRAPAPGGFPGPGRPVRVPYVTLRSAAGRCGRPVLRRARPGARGGPARCPTGAAGPRLNAKQAPVGLGARCGALLSRCRGPLSLPSPRRAGRTLCCPVSKY